MRKEPLPWDLGISKASMLNLLSERLSKPHTRSATLPHTFDPTASVTHDRNQTHETKSQNHANGPGLDIPSTIPESVIPTLPLRAHRSSHTGSLGSSRDLPPLVTAGLHPNTSSVPKLDPSTQPEDFSHSSESSRHPSPTRHSIKTEPTNAEGKTPKISSWFQGESQPIKVGLVPSPAKEKANPLDPTSTTMSTRPTGVLHRKSTSQVLPAMASRFSFFNSKASLPKISPSNSNQYDELADIDINAALFPGGAPEAFSPAAFKNLQQQAEGALTRLQAAYRERATAFKDMAAEKEALSEETQGAETRARHLKMQLDAMAEQLAEQDRAMMNMVDELAREKLARREEEEARKRSVRLVEQDFTPPRVPRSRPRRSTLSDSGFESEDDSSAESVFSRRDGTQSPTMSMSSVSTESSPEILHSRDIVQSPTQAARLRIPPNATKPVQQPCANCHGIRASDAWLVVSVLKEENQALKKRVGELEGALDGCLDVVGRLGG